MRLTQGPPCHHSAGEYTSDESRTQNATRDRTGTKISSPGSRVRKHHDHCAGTPSADRGGQSSRVLLPSIGSLPLYLRVPLTRSSARRRNMGSSWSIAPLVPDAVPEDGLTEPQLPHIIMHICPGQGQRHKEEKWPMSHNIPHQ